MTLNIKNLLGIAVLFSFSVISAQVRTSYTFEKGWKFTREDNADFIQPDYNDVKWQSVVVPHDWAIYGPFGIDNDKQLTAIAQDGQKEAMEETFRIRPPGAIKGITMLVTAVRARRFRSTMRVWREVSVWPTSPR